MIDRQSQSDPQIGFPDRQRLARASEDQVDRNVIDRRGDPLDDLGGLAAAVTAFERLQLRIVERLHAETDTIDARILERGQCLVVDIFGIGFDRPFHRIGQNETLVNATQQPSKLPVGQVGGCAAAHKNGADCRPVEQGELPVDRIQKSVGEFVPAGHDAEVAIAAAVPAKRDVQIHRPGKRPASRRRSRCRRTGGGSNRRGLGHNQSFKRPSSISGKALRTKRLT